VQDDDMWTPRWIHCSQTLAARVEMLEHLLCTCSQLIHAGAGVWAMAPLNPLRQLQLHTRKLSLAVGAQDAHTSRQVISCCVRMRL
jgi:hypothetical protein